MSSKKHFGQETEFSEDAKRLAGEGEGELWMDIQRKRLIAQQYLTYIGEAKEWIEACINEELPPITQMDDGLRNGVYLAKLARFYAPEMVKKVFDEKQELPLSLRHSDNFNAFMAASLKVGLPKIFNFELTDLYDKKNIPKVIYNIHALSHFLAKLGIAPKMKRKKFTFTDEELAAASEYLGDMQLPSFGDIAAQLDKETGAKQDELAKSQQEYEEMASDLSRWIEEKTTNMNGREFLSYNSKEVQELLSQLEEFEKGEKQEQKQKLVETTDKFNAIEEKAKTLNKPPFQPEEWLSIPKLESAWTGLEDSQSKRSEALRFRKELAELEEKAKLMKNWLSEQASFLARKNLNASTAEDISQLEGGLQSFRDNDKKTKKGELNELEEALDMFQKKCEGENLEIFGTTARKYREELEKGWGTLEESEKLREQSIAFNADIYKRKQKYTNDAEELTSWMKSKTEEMNKRDYSGKKSGELKALMESVEEFKGKERKEKFSKMEDVKSDFHKINADLSIHEYHEFEPKEGLTLEDMQSGWENLDLSIKSREDDLRMKHELALMEEAYEKKSKELVDWIKHMIELRNQRNFPKTSEDCVKLAFEEENFKRTEKAKKGETKEELNVEYSNITSKIKKEGHDEFKIIEEQMPAGIATLWAQLEKAEVERSRALAEEQVRLGGQERLQLLKDHVEFWTKIQAIARGNEVRREMKALLKHYSDNTGKIIKIQALQRGKVAGFHYRALQKENPPVQTTQRFLYLVDDSDKDFAEELELEKLKQQVVSEIRDNNEREKILNMLDIKIALLIKNRTTLEDVVASSKEYIKKQKKEAEAHNEQSLKSLDKEARSKLESYQHLFYLLQTEPKYMARLIFQLKKKDKVSKFIESVVLTLYGYAQNSREEYLLLQLIKDAIALEMENVSEVQDIVRGNPVFIKLVVQYTRGAKEREFLRDLLQPLVKDILEQRELDLDVDPLSIYRNMIKEEESRTGEKSSLAYDVSRSQALENDKVMKIFVKRLKDLRAVTEKFLNAIIASLNKLPYGLRYIASQMKKVLETRFPGDEEKVLKIVGNLIYYRYMNPAVVAPEGFDVIESMISPTQRKNLAEISKMLQQISVHKLFEDEFFYLSALNDYITKAKTKFFKFFYDCCVVQSPEDYFHIDKYDDFSKVAKPVVFISQEEIYFTHALILDDLDEIAPDKADQLRVILKDLGNPPEGAAENTTRGTEMNLQLVNRFTAVATEDSALKALFLQTKRYIITILRIQNGENLLEILEKPSNDQSEKSFSERQKKETERAKEREARGVATDPTLDITHFTYPTLKKKTLENLVELEKKGLVKKSNNYQEMVNAIAKDIKNKNRRRIQRKKELEKVKATLANLEEKTKYLDAQKDSYNDYVKSCVDAMKDKNNKKGKKSRPLPFTRQYFHEKELQKQGKQYEFGSFKYTADQLFEKGVLVDLQGVTVSQRSKVTITVSSAEVGVFEVEGKFMGLNVSSEELRLDDLLQKQFENVQVMTLFGVAKVNVNLLIFLINKKFYK